jgi:hypothetical protein
MAVAMCGLDCLCLCLTLALFASTLKLKLTGLMETISPGWLQIGFAAGTMAIAGGLTHGMTWGLVAMGGEVSMVVILGVAGVVLLVTNSTDRCHHSLPD